MIVHEITKYSKEVTPVAAVVASATFRGIIGSEHHKRFIHQRVLSNCKLMEGEHVVYRGKVGIILDILDDNTFDKVEWNDLECKCVDVFFYADNSTELFHPSSLKRHNKCS